MELLSLIYVFAVGLAAGFINVMAGGGSLLTLPMLIFIGLPSPVANGTNRIAIMAQNLTAIQSFRAKGIFHWKQGLYLAIPAVIGSIIGANLAVDISEESFNKTLSIVMLVVLVIILFKPHQYLTKKKQLPKFLHQCILLAAFFLVGLYGGFIQAGVGFVIIAALSIMTSHNLVHINSLKLLIVAVYTVASLIVFIIHDQVAWGYGISLALGMSLGAYIGAQTAMKKGEGFIRVILVLAVIAMSIKLWFDGT
ncbi:sulfite exporter TauE/SafE family protein [Thalassobacillus pellis]|uniref:sulfite exporter TauE/SafE family protein n=1 Tax=Thalassobacillus pellis TaxID=748008 RepID=UPI00195F26FC|nr:sulfite exporter TauE/SafE family protein [Thalassobacillus pellis]MBM7552981.1 putative membrane protein YfcA [Thalassobacillus pellis]